MESPRHVDLVVACTKRKRVTPASALRFRSILPDRPDAVATAWLELVRASPTQRLEELYCGPGWAASLRARDRGRECGALRFHVASAGLGLVSEGTTIPAYSATFATDEDQVARRLTATAGVAAAHREWWRALNSSRGLGETPVSTALAGSECVLVAVGADYLRAMLDDLEVLAQQLGPERLFVVSAGAATRSLPEVLGTCLLPVRVEFEAVHRGTRNTLNAWAASWLLACAARVGWSRAAIDRELQVLVASGHGGVRRSNGKAQTDDEVRAWIRRELERNPKATGLLARFRGQGLACLDTRFRRLAGEVRQVAGSEATP
jgi:hypothetical protein